MTKTRPPVSTARSHFRLFYLCLVIAVGFGLRVAGLNSLPLSLSLDEAVNGIDALRLYRAGWLTPFLQNNFGRETLFFYLQSLALQFFGISIFALRFASVVAGTLTIPLLYSVGQRLRLNDIVLSKPLSLNMPSMLAATGLAISYWHIYFSRVALRASLLPPLLLGLVWCFWQGWYGCPSSAYSRIGQRRYWLVASGFVLGLTFYTYLAARVLPLLFITFLAVELATNKSNPQRKVVDFLIFGLTSILTAIPLAVYFFQNPQAIGGRTQAISIFTANAPLYTLTRNLTAVLQTYFFSGTWLGQWPALNGLSALGFLAGLLVCLARIKKAPSRFLLLWWVVGMSPMVFSQQNWGATTTILRSIVAWPALFLISGIGLTALANSLFALIRNLRRTEPEPQDAVGAPKWMVATLLLLLVLGGLSSTYNYFSIWATTHNNRRDDGAVQVARYLNNQTSRPSLVPLSMFKESTTNFLLQARYPQLDNIEISSLRTLVGSNQQANPGQVGAVYVLPHEPAFEGAFVLLVPSPTGPGTAYLLPPLTAPEIEALYTNMSGTFPLITILNDNQEPVAHVYPLVPDAPFLPSEPIIWQPMQANFNNDIWLTGYRVEPVVAKSGDVVTLHLSWKMQGPVDGDYYVFLHLFDISQGQRRGQSNLPLNSIIHRWSAPLAFVDTYHFRLPPDSPEGVYLFELGLYHNFSFERLPVIIGGAKQPDDKVFLGKFRVQLQAPPPPQYPIQAQFGESVALVGGDFPERSLHPGQTLLYTLHWKALDTITQDYTVFNHVLDAEGNIRAQQDSMPQGNRYPTSMWDRGELVRDSYAISLPLDLEPGQYTLRIGLYEPQTGQRLALKNETRDFLELLDFISVIPVEESMDPSARPREAAGE